MAIRACNMGLQHTERMEPSFDNPGTDKTKEPGVMNPRQTRPTRLGEKKHQRRQRADVRFFCRSRHTVKCVCAEVGEASDENPVLYVRQDFAS